MASVSNYVVALGATFVHLVVGCEDGGVGAPCVPEDEFRRTFQGFAIGEVNVESRSFQCESRICLVNHFEGRVSCPYGAPADPSDHRVVDPSYADPCRIPGTRGGPGQEVAVPVRPQLVARPPTDAVYCSCRCDGPDDNARYCDCPSGFECVELVQDLGFSSAQLAGSYCIKEGTAYDRTLEASPACDPAFADCGEPHPGPI